jgi:hypothetical protein
MGRSAHDVNCPPALHGIGLLQSLATRHGTLSNSYPFTNLLITILAIAVWCRLSDPEKALCRQDT